MLNWHTLEGFEWDAGNRFKSEQKHGVHWQEAEEIFANEPLLVVGDTAHSAAEPRFHALGKTDAGRLLHITFTIRGKYVRVISARPMHKKERTLYEKA